MKKVLAVATFAALLAPSLVFASYLPYNSSYQGSYLPYQQQYSAYQPASYYYPSYSYSNYSYQNQYSYPSYSYPSYNQYSYGPSVRVNVNATPYWGGGWGGGWW